MNELLITSAIIAFYIWLTEEDGMLRKPFAWLASRVSSDIIRKALFDCLHCRTFWATVLVMSLHATTDIRYLLAIPLVWILSITGYRLL